MNIKIKNFLSVFADLIWLGTSHFGRMRNKEYIYKFKSKALNLLLTYFVVLIVFILYILFSLFVQNVLHKVGILAKSGLVGLAAYWYLWIIYFLIYIVSLEEIARRIDKNLNKKTVHF